MKKIIYLFTVLAFFLLPIKMQAQSYFSSERCFRTSCCYGDGLQMTYTQTSLLYTGRFFKGLPGNSIPNTQILNGYAVSDMAIIHDTLYIAGTTSGNKGFYGWANTYNNQAWTFNIYTFEPSDTNYLKNARKIKVFRSDGDLHVLLIGDRVYRNDTRSCIIDVKNNSTCRLAFSPVENYDDVELTENYVVTVERKGNGDPKGEPFYLRILPKSSFSLSNAMFNTYYANGYPVAVSAPLLQAVGGDSVVLAFNNGSSYYLGTFSINSGTLYAHKQYTVPKSNTVTVNDMAYNPDMDAFMVAYKVNNTGMTDIYLCTNYPSLSLYQSSKPNSQHSFSIKNIVSCNYNPSWDFYATGYIPANNFFNRLYIVDPGLCITTLEHSMTVSDYSTLDTLHEPTIDSLTIYPATQTCSTDFLQLDLDCDDQHIGWGLDGDGQDDGDHGRNVEESDSDKE